MPNQWFRFKQFTVWQDLCAMKVGTDAVLLGAWTHYANVLRVLDMGTGTGVLALIAAQRNKQAIVHAVDIDPAAVLQARVNAASSPWPERIHVHCADVRSWTSDGNYDLVLCNPPYYDRHLRSSDARVAMAKHEVELNLDQLFRAADRLCNTHGRVSLILPADRLKDAQAGAKAHGFVRSRTCFVRYRATTPPKRVLVEFSHEYALDVLPSELAVEQVRGAFSPEYRELLQDLELHF